VPDPLQILEALLFASDIPVEVERIQEALDLPTAAEARALIKSLQSRYDGDARGLMIVEVGGGFRMATRPELAPWLVRLARSRTRARLSRSALETLAIVSYRQPVSRPEIDAIRGVNSEAVLDNLLERGLIRISGRKDAPGRPFLYETTREFLMAFGLRTLDDLPKVEAKPPEGEGQGTPGGAEESATPVADNAPQQDPGPGRARLETGE
jgi:segregation and condensation protein B